MFRALVSPRMVGLHLLTIVATTAAVLLGLWQYDAWQIHRENQAHDLANVAPRPLENVMSADDPYPGDAVGRPVRFAGAWLPHDTLFVADREQDGRSGFWVVTPVSVCDANCPHGPAMLVVRGWTPRPAAAPPAPTGRVKVTGWLQPPEGSGVQDPDPGDDVLPELRIASAIQHVDQDLYGAYVIAEELSPGPATANTGPTRGDLVAVTPASLPQPETFTAIRNLLYALEWWIFGGFAVFLWWRWCSDEVKRSRATTVDQPAEDAEVASTP